MIIRRIEAFSFYFYPWHLKEFHKGASMENDFDYSGQILFMDVREYLPTIDPESLSKKHTLQILLYIMNQKENFHDRGHEENNEETAWVNGYLLKLVPDIDRDGMQRFLVQCIGSSVDKIAMLK